MYSGRLLWGVAATLCLSGGASWADMSVQLLAPWTGGAVPAGQQCKLHGGNGSTPPMKVSGLPAGTAGILVEYDDKTYKPLSRGGGHGSLLYPASGTSATLRAVPGMTNRLPGGVRVHKPAKSKGEYASPGYLPPCSGGRGNRYTATLKPISAQGKVLDSVTITIGKY